jgi:hypothetical protein
MKYGYKDVARIVDRVSEMIPLRPSGCKLISEGSQNLKVRTKPQQGIPPRNMEKTIKKKEYLN